MRLPQFQFTIRHLIIVIAVFAACFALLRSPFGLNVVYGGAVPFGLYFCVLPGFLIGRARGGSGIIGGAFSEAVAAAMLVIVLSSPKPPYTSAIVHAIPGFLILTSLVMAFSFILGLLVSGSLYLIVEVTQIILHIEPLAGTSGPRRLYPEPDWPVTSDDPQGNES